MATYYVSPSGSNSNDGLSLGAPWLTLQYAADTAVAASTIYVRAGTYTGFSLSRDQLSFVAYPGDAQPTISQFTSFPVTISANNATLDGFKIRDANVQWGGGVRVTGATRTGRVNINNCYFTNNRSFGIYLSGTRNVTIDDCDFTQCDSGVQISGDGLGVNITNSRFFNLTTMVINNDPNGDPSYWGSAGGDRGANAVIFYQTTGPTLVDGCSFVGLRAVSYEYGRDGEVFNIYESRNIEIRNSWGYDCNEVLEVGRGTGANCGNIKFHHNRFWHGPQTTTVGPRSATQDCHGMILRSMDNSQIYNNTFDGLSEFHYWITEDEAFAGNVANLKIKNNIHRYTMGLMYSIGTITSAGVEIDYNLGYRNGGGTWGDTQATSPTDSQATFYAQTGWGQHDIQANPLFVAASGSMLTNPDYRLQATSPAVDSGAVLPPFTDGYLGAAPDRGYVEYQTGAPVPPSNFALQDSFSRTLVDSLGSPDVGPAWLTNGVASNFDISGGFLLNTHTAANSQLLQWSPINTSEQEMIFRWSIDKIPSGGNGFIGPIMRVQDANNFYRFVQKIFTSATTGVALEKVVNGVVTQIGAEQFVANLPIAVNKFYKIRAVALGSNLKMRVWEEGTPEPTQTWHLDLIDSTFTGTGGIGIRTQMGTGLTNPNYIFRIDDVESPNPRRFTADAVLRKNSGAQTFTADAVLVLLPFTVRNGSFTADSVLKKNSGTQTFTADAFLRLTTANVYVFNADAVLKKTTSTTFTADAVIKRTVTPTFTADAVLVTSAPQIVTYAYDNFADKFANIGLFDATIGGSYTVSNTTGEIGEGYDELNVAYFIFNTAGTTHFANLLSVSARDVDFVTKYKRDKVSSGADFHIYFPIRITTGPNYYRPRVVFRTNGAVTCRISKVVANVATDLGANNTNLTLNSTANAYYWTRVQADGANPTTLRMRTWMDGTPEPLTWDITLTDSEPTTQVAGGVGMRAWVGAANNLPVRLSYDIFTASSINPVAGVGNGSFTADAVLKKNSGTKTFTADAVLQAVGGLHHGGELWGYDNFNEPVDGTLLINHTSDSGHGWGEPAGLPYISQGRVYPAASGNNMRMLGVGGYNGRIKFVFNFGADGIARACSTRLRYLDNANFFMVTYRRGNTGVNQITMWRREANVMNGPLFTATLGAGEFAANTEYTADVEFFDTTIKAYVNGVLKLTGTSTFNVGVDDATGVVLSFDESMSTGQYFDYYEYKSYEIFLADAVLRKTTTNTFTANAILQNPVVGGGTAPRPRDC